MHLTTSKRRSARLGLVALSFFIVLAVAAWTSPGDAPAVDATEDAPGDLVITSPRICAALAVYELANADDWGLRATIANATLNAFNDAQRVPDCASGVGAASLQDSSPRAGSWPSMP